MKNIRCLLAYLGTHYFGFQKTKTGPSIEETVQAALEQILQHRIELQAGSRTDRGVHAKGQVINFFSDSCKDLGQLHASLRALLPGDIAPLQLEEAHPKFHPTLWAKGKEYVYQVCYGKTQLPSHHAFSWHFPHMLDLEAMQRAAQTIVGTRDFSSFTNKQIEDPVRTLTRIEIEDLGGERLCIRVCGDHFLYKMVRNIVGSLCYTGCGRLSAALDKIRLRKEAGPTAPAHGLCLEKILY